MKHSIAVNVSLGIFTELLYVFAIILAALAACLVISLVKP